MLKEPFFLRFCSFFLAFINKNLCFPYNLTDLFAWLKNMGFVYIILEKDLLHKLF